MQHSEGKSTVPRPGRVRLPDDRKLARPMSRKTIEVVIDDLTEMPIPDGQGRNIEFSFDGARYEIDLANENIAALETALAPFVAAAREVTPGKSLEDVLTELQAPQARARVREWANNNGLKVSPRGRIPKDVVLAYTRRLSQLS